MKKILSLAILIVAVISLTACGEEPENINIVQHGLNEEEVNELINAAILETKVIYVDKEVVVIETVIEYVEVPVLITENDVEIIYVEIPCENSETTLIAMANHQDYVDWLDDYDNFIDDFIDELYRETFYFDNLLEDYQQYLSTKMTNGETLSPEEVEFLLDYQQRLIEWYEFEDWVEDEAEQRYNELMDSFPIVEEEVNWKNY